MGLIKSICAVIENGKVISPQMEITMHFLEEAATKAYWAISEVSKKVPSKPSMQEQHDWLIQNGVEYVREKIAEWQKIYEEYKPLIESAEQTFQLADQYWNSHKDLCVANGLDPDTYKGDANKDLAKK